MKKLNRIQFDVNTVIFSRKSEKEVRHAFETRRYSGNKNMFGQANGDYDYVNQIKSLNTFVYAS